jgi:hypothetical protein
VIGWQPVIQRRRQQKRLALVIGPERLGRTRRRLRRPSLVTLGHLEQPATLNVIDHAHDFHTRPTPINGY